MHLHTKTRFKNQVTFLPSSKFNYNKHISITGLVWYRRFYPWSKTCTQQYFSKDRSTGTFKCHLFIAWCIGQMSTLSQRYCPFDKKTFKSKICTHTPYFCWEIKRNRCSTHITQHRTTTDIAASTFPHALHPLFLQPALQTCYPLQPAAVLKTWLNMVNFHQISQYWPLTITMDIIQPAH